MEKTYTKGFIPYALAAFMVGIVGGFSAVLSPAFVQDIGIDYNNTTWTALALAISTAAFAPVMGKVGDVIGRRMTLLLGVAVFTLGNILTAVASSLIFMLFARFVVGIGTAAITPMVMSYIVTEFPPHAAAKGFSVYMLISSASVIFGPTLGGLIVKTYGWRVMVWVCTAICLGVLLLCLVVSGERGTKRGTLKGFDGYGAALVPVFFGLVLCLPSFGQNIGWTSRTFWGVLTAAVAAFIVLIIIERKAENPILDGGFMKRKVFILSVAALFLTQGLMQANMTNTIVFVNYTQPDNSVISSYAISVMYLGMSLGSVFLGPMADKKEPKRVLTGSLLITGIGCVLQLLFSVNTPVILLMASLGILGFGLGANGTIFMKVVLSGLSDRNAGTGTGTYGLFRDLAAPFGVSVFVPLFTNLVTDLASDGVSAAQAAVRAIKTLGIIEIICVAAGVVTVLFLPKIIKNRTNNTQENP